jgi:hypothetical protein
VTTTTTTTAFPAWKPSPRHAAMMSEPATYTPPAQTVTHEWGFGARGAAKTWTSPATASVPTDWWKQDRHFA